MIKLLYYPALYFFILCIQYFIIYIFSKDLKISFLKDNLLSMLLASIFLGGIMHIFSTYFEFFDNKVLFYIALSITIYGFWFIINPLLNVILSKKHLRDYNIENQLKTENQNFKVYFTDKMSSNAIATGIIPFYKIIIISKDLKSSLNDAELKAIIYHEIGHHKKNHIFTIYILNVIIFTTYLYGYSLLADYEFQSKFYEGLSVFLSGAICGLACYYIPNKILYFLEYQADSFSASINDKESMIKALISLDKLTDGKLTKGNIKHPNLEKRIANLEN